MMRINNPQKNKYLYRNYIIQDVTTSNQGVATPVGQPLVFSWNFRRQYAMFGAGTKRTTCRNKKEKILFQKWNSVPKTESIYMKAYKR